MDLKTLDSKHPSFNAERWCQIEALAAGGEDFKKHLHVFLPQNPVEPDDVYTQRKAQAHFTNYMGSIINLYTSWLFATSFSAKAFERGTTTPIANLPTFYGAFQEDVGGEKQLSAFMEERFRDALKTQVSYWLIELPSNDGQMPGSKDEYEQRGLGNASLTALDRCDVYDWQEDNKGAFNWVLVHTCVEPRVSWTDARDSVTETWRIYDRVNVSTFQITYKKGKRPRDPKTEIAQIGPAVPHGFKRVPIVRLALKKDVTIGEETFDNQLEHFRLDNALSWLIRRTCYAQPVFHVEDPENNPPKMGVGYSLMLGKDDKMGWTAPPVAPFDVLAKNVDKKREDIYRIVHQMAQSVDNNAETVGRSADSKEIDAAATRIMLNAYGKYLCAPLEETYEIITEARGDGAYEWSIEGFSGYDTATVASLIANSKEARGLGIPSVTFQKEICTKTALAMLPEIDQRMKDKIRKEINMATFKVDSVTLDEKMVQGPDAKSDLDRAKASAEPIKAKAAMKSASQPKAAPPASGASPKPSK